MPKSEQDLETRLEELAKEHEELLEAARKRYKQEEERWGDVEKVPAFIQLRDSFKQRIDQLETRLNRPNLGDGGAASGEDATRMAEARAAFAEWTRSGTVKPTLERALSTDASADGGVMVPKPLMQALRQAIVDISPIRANAAQLTITQGNEIVIPEEKGEFAAGWVGEREARPETAAGQFKLNRIPLREAYANPAATSLMLQDSGFDVEAYFRGKLAERFSQLENKAFLDGDNVKQPEGILTNADIPKVKTGSAAALTADGLIDLIYKVPTRYASGMKLYLKRESIIPLRKLKDANGQYLWQPSLQQGLPATFAGVSMVETPDMPAVGAGALSVLAGNLRTGYQVADKASMTMLRDPYTNKPFVNFYTTWRVGGAVVKPEALAIQEVAA